jgi:hypothetical protein
LAEAIFGLVGVVIGGVITGAANYVAERRKERATSRKATRLLLLNWPHATRYLETLLTGGTWQVPPEPVEWLMNIWASARVELAAPLEQDTWDAIVAPISVMDYEIRDWIAKGNERRPLNDTERDKIVELIGALARGEEKLRATAQSS